MRRILMAGFVLGCLAWSVAGAEQIDRSQGAAMVADMQARLNAAPDPSLTPVDQLSCEQMYGELMIAGQQMNAQLDPSFAANAQALQDQMTARQSGSVAGSVAAGFGQAMLCSVPGVGMACGAMMQAQIANQMRDAQQHQQQMDVMMSQMNDATAGIDMGRMQAINERWEAQQCQAPQEAQ